MQVNLKQSGQPGAAGRGRRKRHRESGPSFAEVGEEWPTTR